MKTKIPRVTLPLALLALLSVSCGKQEEGRTDEGFEPYQTWTNDSTNNFWEKGQGDGIAFAPGREEDTTLFI